MPKSAVTALVKSLAREAEPDGVAGTAMAPGEVDTAMPRTGTTEADLDASRRSVPMRRYAEPLGLVLPPAFMLNPGASYVTGATLPVTATNSWPERGRQAQPGRGGWHPASQRALWLDAAVPSGRPGPRRRLLRRRSWLGR